MSASNDKEVLYGFDWHGRSEPIRMMYHMKGVEYEDHRIAFSDWESQYKKDMPLEAVPVLKTPHGTINQSQAIARYVAHKLGFMGDNLWEATLHDVIQENVTDAAAYVSGLYFNKVEGGPEPPKNQEQTKEFCLKVAKLIQNMAEKRGKKFLVGDQIGLGDIWLYTTLQYWTMMLPDLLDSSQWLTDFEKQFESLEAVKKYLEQRPKDNSPDKVKEKLGQTKSE